MRNLIKREWQIVLSNKSFLLSVLLCIVSVLALGGINNAWEQKFYQRDWRSDLRAELIGMQEQLNDAVDDEERKLLQNGMKILEYRLENEISDTNWKKGLVSYYIKRGAGDADEQLAIDTALEKDDWKIYYKYLDSVYQQIVNHPASTVKERREAEIRLEVNRLYFDYDIEPESMSDYYEDWRNQEINHYIEAKTALMNAELYEGAEEYYLTETQKKQLQEEVKVALYRIKNNVPTNEGSKKAEFLELSQNVKYIGYLCAIVLFVQIFVRDFERKNMTQLGLQPYSRKELFWSKVCSMLLISSALLFVCFLSSAILANVLYQETINDCILILEENVVQMNFYGYILLMYVLGEVEVMIAAAFIIWFGICGFSSAFTIVIGCVLFFGKFALALAANRYHIFALRFVPLVWFDWSQFLRGDILVAGTTVGLSVIGTIVIGGLLLISAYRQYMRMDF